MLKALLLYVKYPSVAGIIGTIWVASGVLLIYDRNLPILTVTVVNMLASIVIGTIGFRADKN